MFKVVGVMTMKAVAKQSQQKRPDGEVPLRMVSSADITLVLLKPIKFLHNKDGF